MAGLLVKDREKARKERKGNRKPDSEIMEREREGLEKSRLTGMPVNRGRERKREREREKEREREREKERENERESTIRIRQ